jgi:PilZ domain
MDAAVSPRQTRTEYRHELRTLTYVTLDEANGGIVRNLTRHGIGVQAVAALHPGQQVRLRFDLRYPRLRVEAGGEVMWATRSGLCGIRFLDAASITRQIDEWIFANLLDGMSLLSPEIAPNPDKSSRGHSTLIQPMDGQLKLVGSPPATIARAKAVAEVDDGLVISPTEVKVIELATEAEAPERHYVSRDPLEEEAVPPALESDWLSRRLSGRGLALLVNAMVMVAAVLLSALIFLSVTGETPRWPAAMSAGAVTVVAALYWGFFKLFGNESPGARLVRLAGFDSQLKEEEQDTRFR